MARGRRAWRVVVLLLVLLLAAGAVGEWRFGYGRDWVEANLLQEPADPLVEPEEVPPPPGLTLVEPAAPVAVADAGPLTDSLRPAKVERALAPYLRDEDLGKRVHVAVSAIGSGRSLYTYGDPVAVPASTTKILTTAAALAAMGPDRVFTTRVATAPRGGRIVLVGGGDPYLASGPDSDGTAYPLRADVQTLARRTAKALTAQGRERVRLGYDTSLFAGPTENPRWEPDYVATDVVAPISPLWVDGGRSPSGFGRVDDPALHAAEVFAAALRKSGIDVRTPPTPTTAGTGWADLATVDSAPLDQIVERILEVSDNEGAEILAHQTGLAISGEGSFEAGARDALATLGRLGIDVAGTELYDGSGLSRDNRIPAAVLLAVLELAAAADHPELRSVVSGLPVAGFTGSLADRFEGEPAAGRGRVRAKTGTLSGISGLAGIATDLDGSTLAFVLVADRITLPDTLEARATLDDMAAALGACRCG